MHKIHHLISFIAVSIFIGIAFASFGPDASTNTSVAISNCEESPVISGQLTIHVNLRITEADGKEEGISAPGKLFIVHQKVDSDKNCTYTSSSQVIDFETDHSGLYTYSGTPWTHDNLQDLFRVEIQVPGSLFDFYGPYKNVVVDIYQIEPMTFSTVLPGIL